MCECWDFLSMKKILHNPPAWHAISHSEAAEKLGTSGEAGLSHSEVSKRLNVLGSNTLPQPKLRSLSSIFFHQFLSPLIYLLLASAIMAFFIGEEKDSVVILIIVLFNAIIGAYQEGRAEHSLQALRNLSKLKTRVLRNGQEFIIEASELVPGDILKLAAGDAVPADAKLIEATALATAEAALTGESIPVSKSVSLLAESTGLADRQNMIYAGTYITAGRCTAIVTATGIFNEIGKIAQLATSTSAPKTQLEQRIQQFGRYLVVAAILLFLLVMVIGLWREISFANIFMIAISQMVSLVPEGLSVAMTIALAVGVQRMAKRGSIVRRLAAVETLGSITVICSDKTGTLTRNEMTVTSIYLPALDSEITVTGAGYSPLGDFFLNNNKLDPSSNKSLQKLFEACVLCNDSQLVGPKEKKQQWKILGDPTEGALLSMAAKASCDFVSLRNTLHRQAELPFDSNSKLMATQHEYDKKSIVYIKGAPESLIDLCGSVFLHDHIEEFDEQWKIKIKFVTKKMADSALRLLAVGYIPDAYIDGSKGFLPFTGKVTLLGIIGELDPPRSEVAPAVQKCLHAGIRPVVVTGDHKATGLAIAKSLGISHDHDLAMDGQELDQLSEQELLAKIDQVRVFARVHPAQKLRIVEAYQKKGEVVAMTGDGVNDAPALVRADVGVAMGITGTELAKEAAKIVVTDDNFSTIVTAIAEGRLVYQNIKKLILFLFVTSIDEIVILFLALILGYPPPLAAVQILWINLVTEGTLTVNLIMEPPEGNEMSRPPVSTSQTLLDKKLLMRIPLLSITSICCTFGWFLYRHSDGVSAEQIQTETFTMLAVCQWFNVLNCRSDLKSALNWDLIKNPWLLGGLVLGNLLHILVIYWPPLSNFFHTVPIQLEQFISIGIVASFVLWSEEIRKFFARRKALKISNAGE